LNRKERKGCKEKNLATSLAKPATVRAASTTVRDGRAGVAGFVVNDFARLILGKME
jgi:hypothetical protein